MPHPAQIDYCQKVKRAFPDYFSSKFVLDCGSLEIDNKYHLGNNRQFFENCHYVGVDVCAGNNVDIIKPIHELDYPDGFFDTILSTEMFEHDLHWKASVNAILRMLKPKGLFFFTCATKGRREHGTANNHPEDSPTHLIKGWEKYYKNLTAEDFASIEGFVESFSSCKFYIEQKHHDLYFWGIKK